jgi:hypothetical protein
MDPAAHKPIHFSSIFFPPRRVFGAKISARRGAYKQCQKGNAVYMWCIYGVYICVGTRN